MVTACRDVLSIALKNGGVLKGIAETLKALELGNKVKMVFLAEDCDNDEYKNTVRALARLQGVPLVEIPTWVELKDFCNLGLASKVIAKIAEEKGKEPKIKPRCSVACVIVRNFSFNFTLKFFLLFFFKIFFYFLFKIFLFF